jgi:hypothetical protein
VHAYARARRPDHAKPRTPRGGHALASSSCGTAGPPSPGLVRAPSSSPSTLSPTFVLARAPTHSSSSKSSGSALCRSTCWHQAPPPHRHSSIASAYGSASTSATPCARCRLLSHRGKACTAFPLRGGAMAALPGSLRLAPLHPSSLPSEQCFVLAFISRSLCIPLWPPPRLALADHRAAMHAGERALVLPHLVLVAQQVRVTELSVVVATFPPETSPATRSRHR